MVVAEKAVEGGREANRKMGTRAFPNLMSGFDWLQSAQQDSRFFIYHAYMMHGLKAMIHDQFTLGMLLSP